jgi:potassium efflux system protein
VLVLAVAVTAVGAEEPVPPRKETSGVAATADPAPPAGAATLGTVEAEARALRQETLERLKPEKPAEPDAAAPAAAAAAAAAAPLSKGLREVLEERLHWLDEWEKLAKPRHDGEPTPERQTAARKAELERVKALLEPSTRDPDALLPEVFRNPPRQLSDAVRTEMKEAIDAATAELKDGKAKLEKLRSEITTATNGVPPMRVERDKIHQRLAALEAHHEERAAAVAAAKTPEDATLARERLINFTWEKRVEAERFAAQEALLAQEAARAELAALGQQVEEAHVQLTARTLERMQQRYSRVSDLQERTLQQAAASAQKRADRSEDPLEKYRARRTAELLELQAQVLKFENALTTSPSPSLEEQRGLADRADEDLAGVRALLNDGRISHLDALRLNNDFRRIGPERARVVSHELATAASRLAFYENALSGVEIDLINDSRDDRLQHEDLLERLPKTRHAEALAVYQKIEAQHLTLLERKRAALEKLAKHAEQTHDQIERRIRILDEQYGFIRMNIFCVRDQEPIGMVALAQCRRELAILARSSLKLLRESCDRSLWGRTSPEFAVTVLALIGLPWPLSKLRRSLRPSRPRVS